MSGEQTDDVDDAVRAGTAVVPWSLKKAIASQVVPWWLWALAIYGGFQLMKRRRR